MKITKFLSLALAVTFFMSVAGVDANAANMSKPHGIAADPVAELMGDVTPNGWPPLEVRCQIEQYACFWACEGDPEACADWCYLQYLKCIALG
jgi:hypothetical protein